MTQDGLVDSVVNHIRERHTLKKALEYNNQNLENLTQDKNLELYKTLFYLRHLFQEPFVEKGRTNATVHCGSCISTIWLGDTCIKCKPNLDF